MRIAVVGNMNYGMFALTRHLRDRQIDAQLLVAPGYDHFHPKADTFDLTDLAFCHEVSWLDDGFYGADPDAIRRDMRAYDVVFSTGAEASALSLAGVPIDIYFTYGEDVTKYAHLPEAFSLREIAKEELRYVRKRGALTLSPRAGTQFGHTRRAICKARHVFDTATHPFWGERVLSLPLEGTLHRSPWPLIYPRPYRTSRFPDVHWRSAIDQLRSEHELLLLYHGRHMWTQADPLYSKNTHHLIHGFAQFAQRYPQVRACLATAEYGPDVAASKELIEELGLGDRVVWFPLMYRKDLMYLVHQADLCCGEFGLSYLMGGTIVEALSLGKPFIHHREDAFYDVPLYPLLNAREPAEIATAIAAYLEDPHRWRERGLEAEAWVDEYVIRRPLELICELLSRRDVVETRDEVFGAR
jgi:glycosyltransferase involved in cell wall biosynthesis